MTPIPPKVAAAGLRAYEQARAFEALQRRQLPLIYAALTVLLALLGIPAWSLNSILCVAPEFIALLFAASTAFHWRRLRARHDTNLNFLTQLEMRYGDKLPWIEVERHMTALEKLQAELKAEAYLDAPPPLDDRTADPAQEHPDNVPEPEQRIAEDEHDE